MFLLSICLLSSPSLQVNPVLSHLCNRLLAHRQSRHRDLHPYLQGSLLLVHRQILPRNPHLNHRLGPHPTLVHSRLHARLLIHLLNHRLGPLCAHHRSLLDSHRRSHQLR